MKTPRARILIASAVLLTGAALARLATRTSILRAAGWVLVADEPVDSRRLRRVLRRAMQGLPTRVAIRRARKSPFDPDRWWENPAGIRPGIIELQKLLLDVVRHPIS